MDCDTIARLKIERLEARIDALERKAASASANALVSKMMLDHPVFRFRAHGEPIAKDEPPAPAPRYGVCVERDGSPRISRGHVLVSVAAGALVPADARYPKFTTDKVVPGNAPVWNTYRTDEVFFIPIPSGCSVTPFGCFRRRSDKATVSIADWCEGKRFPREGAPEVKSVAVVLPWPVWYAGNPRLPDPVRGTETGTRPMAMALMQVESPGAIARDGVRFAFTAADPQ